MAKTLADAYYMETFPVTVHTGEASYLDPDSHSQLNEEVYLDAPDEDITVVRTDTPLIVKLGQHHLFVHPHEEVPPGTLAVPRRASTAIDSDSTKQPVLIAKADRAEQLARIIGGELS